MPKQQRPKKKVVAIRGELATQPAKAPDLIQIGQLKAPPGISKSMVTAMGCPRYFTGVYLQRGSLSNKLHFVTREGLQFHEWKKDYASWLRDNERSHDHEYRNEYAERPHLSPAVSAMIRTDESSIDPYTICAVEELFSVDRNGERLPPEPETTPGDWSKHENVLVWGTIDLLLIHHDPTLAEIIDYKAGFSTVNIHDHEPAFYAGLVFLHFPRVQKIKFTWKFVRSRQQKTAEYHRSDLDWIKQMWLAHDADMKDYVARYNAGQKLPVDPSAGFCEYCNLDCEERQRFQLGETIAGPITTDQDAAALVRRLQAFESAVKQIKQHLRPWIDRHGQVEAGNGFVADFQVYETNEYPLDKALPFLGLVQTPPNSTPVGDIPLSGLTIGGLSNYLNRKKRAELKEAIREIANQSAASKLVVRKQEASLEEALVESIKQIEGE